MHRTLLCTRRGPVQNQDGRLCVRHAHGRAYQHPCRLADDVGGTVPGDREEEVALKTCDCLFDLALCVEGAGGG